MPEGPEVTRVTRQLNTVVGNTFLNDLYPVSGRYIKKAPEGYFNLLDDLGRGDFLIKGVFNKGKFIWWELEKDWFIFSTLGMSGNYKLEYNKHSRFQFIVTRVNEFETETFSLYYCDARNFGTLKFVNGREHLYNKLNSLGPDMLNDPCDFTTFLEICRKYSNKSVVKFMMEQKHISGVGNIYKSESLFLARISPFKTMGELSDEDLKRLYKAIIKVLKTSLEQGGATIQSYSDLYASHGNYTRFPSHPQEMVSARESSRVMVYGQKNDIYGNKVLKAQLDDKRTTYYSPDIQCVDNIS